MRNVWSGCSSRHLHLYLLCSPSLLQFSLHHGINVLQTNFWTKYAFLQPQKKTLKSAQFLFLFIFFLLQKEGRKEGGKAPFKFLTTFLLLAVFLFPRFSFPSAVSFHCAAKGTTLLQNVKTTRFKYGKSMRESHGH